MENISLTFIILLCTKIVLSTVEYSRGVLKNIKITFNILPINQRKQRKAENLMTKELFYK